MGFPGVQEVIVKYTKTVKSRILIRDEILQVDGVTGAEVTRVEYDRQNRAATFTYTCSVGEEIFREEVTLYG